MFRADLARFVSLNVRIVPGVLYFGGLDNSVYAVYAGSGVVKWKHTGIAPVAGSVAFVRNLRPATPQTYRPFLCIA